MKIKCRANRQYNVHALKDLKKNIEGVVGWDIAYLMFFGVLGEFFIYQLPALAYPFNF